MDVVALWIGRVVMVTTGIVAAAFLLDRAVGQLVPQGDNHSNRKLLGKGETRYAAVEDAMGKEGKSL